MAENSTLSVRAWRRLAQPVGFHSSKQSAGPTGSSVRLVGPGRLGTVEVPNPSFTYTRGAVPDGEARTVHGRHRTDVLRQPGEQTLSSCTIQFRRVETAGRRHRSSGDGSDGRLLALGPSGPSWDCLVPQWSRLDTTLITRATITAPNRYESSAWARAMRRMALVVRLVSDTWNVIPMVRAR